MSNLAREALEKLRECLRIEKEEDFDQFRKMVQSLPLDKRRKQGYTWYPVTPLKTGYTIGEHAFVEVERSEVEEKSGGRLFKPGMLVNLFTNKAEESQRECSGVIHYVFGNKMKIILNARDLPDWVGGREMGVDLLFDERTFLEMDKALSQVLKAKGNRLADLREVLYGQQEARFSFSETEPLEIEGLNASQNKAVQTILAARDLAIVHGPPGTGKTTTLVKAISLLAQRENTILVTAPSNTAADLLTERLAMEKLNVVRIGHVSRIDESLMQHTLEVKLSQHPESKNIKKVKVQAAECRRKAQRYKRHFGGEERRERQLLWEEAKELSAWARQLEDRLLDQILSGADVITSTLTGAAHPVLNHYKFGTVVIDEAAQALEPACWIPLLKAGKVVMAGDPFQLPPTVKSLEARKEGLEKTLIEKCLAFPHVSLLDVQYRMNREIMAFSNQWFYQGILKAHQTVASHRITASENKPVSFIDTAGCGFEEELEPEYKSRYNSGEFNILREHLYQLAETLDPVESPSFGIISPYREQTLFIRKMLMEDERLQNLNIVTDTIDGFQGQEREIIYISLVRSNSNGAIGFLKDYRRMNVALTRARKLLVVIGDSGTIGTDPFYRQFLEHCESEGHYQSAWEFMQ